MLATWQLLENPACPVVGATQHRSQVSCDAGAEPVISPGWAISRESIPARRIQDHRRVYLDYEGPVSSDRGEVVRIDRGPYILLEQRPRRWVFQLAGSVLIGTCELVATDDSGDWRFQCLHAP
jgi:hypothetical protein